MDYIKSRDVYDKLQDDYSCFLYEKRAMYCLSGNKRYLDEILGSIIDKKRLFELVDDMKAVKKRLVIRGAGNDYFVLKKLCPDLEFAFFVDYDTTKHDQYIDGKKVISLENFYSNYSDYYVLVNSAAANQEIIDELKSHGIADEKIFNLASCYERICDKQYFEEDIVVKTPGEVFVDGGCYDGRTIRQFCKWCNGDYKKIFSFEPDKNNYDNALNMLRRQKIRDVVLLNKGLWSSMTELSFLEDGSQAARINENGKTIIKTATIDDTVGDEKVTFIKLDVEGAEYETLLGARNTIEKYHPKLAISIYHKPQDIFELPELILSMNSQYRLYLRHYQLSPNETILYCV